MQYICKTYTSTMHEGTLSLAALALMLDNADNAAGPPKGIAKLLTVSDSGRMRSPPLVEKFRRAKENLLQNWQSQPTNGKLLSLERMFHEVRPPMPILTPKDVA